MFAVNGNPFRLDWGITIVKTTTAAFSLLRIWIQIPLFYFTSICGGRGNSCSPSLIYATAYKRYMKKNVLKLKLIREVNLSVRDFNLETIFFSTMTLKNPSLRLQGLNVPFSSLLFASLLFACRVRCNPTNNTVEALTFTIF